MKKLIILLLLCASVAWGADWNAVPVDRELFSATCVRCGETYTRPCDPDPAGDCMVGNIQRMLCPTCEKALQKWLDEKGYSKTDNWDDHLSYDSKVSIDKDKALWKAYPTSITEATR